MRVLGIDYGDKHIGLALSDETGKIALAHSVISGESKKKAVNEIKRLAAKNGVKIIVLGSPINMNNTRGERYDKTAAFKEKLERNIKRVEIALWDERLSTAAALLVLTDVGEKNKKNFVDKIAATIILQNYLDWLNNKGEKN
jgi:putative Holliday junction resolvase